MSDRMIDVVDDIDVEEDSVDESASDNDDVDDGDHGNVAHASGGLAVQVYPDDSGGHYGNEYDRVRIGQNRGGLGRYRHAGDFGPVQYGGMSRLQLPTLRTPSRTVPGVEYEWSFQMKRGAKRNRHGNIARTRFEPIKIPRGLSDAEFLRSDYWAELMRRSIWVCLNCSNVTPKGSSRIRTIMHVRDGRMVTDPDNPPNLPHACTQSEENILISIVHSVKRRMWRRMRQDGDPLGALRDARYEMTERCRLMDQTTLDNMLAQLPDEKQAMRHMKLMRVRNEYKAMGKRYGVPDPNDPELSRTEMERVRQRMEEHDSKLRAEAAAATLGLLGGHVVVKLGEGGKDEGDDDEPQSPDLLDDGDQAMDGADEPHDGDGDEEEEDDEEGGGRPAAGDTPPPPNVHVYGDFGPAEYGGMTRVGMPSLRSDSRLVPGVEYEWSLVTKKSHHLKMPRGMTDAAFLTSASWTKMMETSQYSCMNCSNLWTGQFGRNRYRVMLTVKNGRMVSDPDKPPGTSHECIASEENIVWSIVASIKRRMQRRMRADGDFKGALCAARYELSERFRGLPKEQFDEIMARLPSYDAVQRSVRRKGFDTSRQATREREKAMLGDVLGDDSVPVNMDLSYNYTSQASICSAKEVKMERQGKIAGRRAGEPKRPIIEVLEGADRAGRLRRSYEQQPVMGNRGGMATRGSGRFSSRGGGVQRGPRIKRDLDDDPDYEPGSGAAHGANTAVDDTPQRDEQMVEPPEQLDEPVDVDSPPAEQTVEPEPPVKRGRGRPRKTAGQRMLDQLDYKPLCDPDPFERLTPGTPGRNRFKCPAFTACPFKYICARCGIGFATAGLHAQHNMAHAKGSAFDCAMCGVRTRSALGFNDHIMWRCTQREQGPPAHCMGLGAALAAGPAESPRSRVITAPMTTAVRRECDAGDERGEEHAEGEQHDAHDDAELVEEHAGHDD